MRTRHKEPNMNGNALKICGVVEHLQSDKYTEWHMQGEGKKLAHTTATTASANHNNINGVKQPHQ